MKRLIHYLFISFIIFYSSSSCGLEFAGTYSGTVDGKSVSIKLNDDGSTFLIGYFPEELSGKWIEEKTFGDLEIWATFDGPVEKPFRIRFELKPENDNFRLVGIKARPMGKGTKLNSVKIKGEPIFKINQ